MSLWTESTFQRAALRTRLKEDTLVACRKVLVDGLPGVEVAAQHKIFSSQLSRAVGILREKHNEILKDAASLQSSEVLGRYTAIQVARNLVGDGLGVDEAEPGKTYEGPIIVNSHGFLIQKVGRSGVAHDLGKLEKLPRLNVPVLIAYPQGEGKATVNEIDLSKSRGKYLER